MLLMKDGKIGPARVKVSSSPAYTVKEIEQAAREYGKFRAPSLDPTERGLLALELSLFLTWLAQREREGRDAGAGS